MADRRKKEKSMETEAENFVRENATAGQRIDPVSGFVWRDDLFFILRKKMREDPEEVKRGNWHMIFLDISGFKEFNDRSGYQEGNRLLRDVSDLVQDVFESGYMTRVYADRFAVVYLGDDVKERVREVHERALKLRPDFRVWVRAGIYDFSGGQVSPDMALDYAKTACDMISQGSQYCSVYSEDLQKELNRKNYILSHIDDAIEKGWIVLYFQPVIRTMNGKICSGEALARWQDPDLGMISPGEFVPVLEENGLSYKLAKFVIDETVGMISSAGRMGMYPIPVSINLSRRDFDEMDPYEEVEKAVRKYGISRNLLCIEITESTAMENPEKIRRYIERFHRAGYEVWMDDFGSAYSSLNALKDFDFDEIKLDLAFMRNFNDKSKKIIASCVNMAKELGIHTLCEGVETREQADFLLNHGCEKIQGFYYSKPLPVEELKELVDRGAFTYELSVERFLYDDAGQIKVDPETPGAILLYQNEQIYPLQISEALKEGLSEAGIDSADLRKPLDIEDTDFGAKLTKVIGNSVTSGSTEEVAYFVNGRYFILTAKTVARSNVGIICTIEMRDITEGARGLVLQNAGSVAQRIVDTYDCVYRLDPDEKEMEVVISDFSGEMSGRRFAFDPEEMAAFIYWRDRERFRKWIDPQNIHHALSDGRKSCSDLFRIEKPDGTRVWEAFTVLGGDGNDEQELLLCMKPSLYSDPGMSRQTENMVASEMFGGDLAVQKSEYAGEAPVWTSERLWNGLMEQDTLMLFWKDRHHRFVGASRSFLEYFGLADFDQIRGKTDEECRWHVDDRTYRDDEDDVLHLGQASACVPGRIIVNGSIRSVVTSKFPVYHDGEIMGLVGIFVDEDTIGEIEGRKPNESKMDSDTGAMTFSAWISEIERYEDNFNHMDEDYRIGVLVVSNYWKIHHEFGEQAAEEMAKVVANTIRSQIPSGCVIGRVDREAFAIVTKNMSMDLGAYLGRISAVLALNHYIGAYSGMIATFSAVASRSEMNNPIRTMGLALERAEKSQSVRNFRNERSTRGTGAAEEREDDTVLTWEEERQKIQVLLHAVDFVRLSDPERKKIIRFDRDGTEKDQRGNCFDIWGTGVPCDNCISLRSLRTKERLTKFETDGENIYIVVSQYQKVEGRDCVLEMVIRMNDSSSMGANERGIFIRALSNCRAKLYDDTLTGIHNHHYYEDILAEHKVQAAAFVEVENLRDINACYGHLAGDSVVRNVAQVIAGQVGYHDVVRYDGSRFLIGLRETDREAFAGKLSDIMKEIRKIHISRYPALAVIACAGGVFRSGEVRELLGDADAALREAEQTGDAVIKK